MTSIIPIEFYWDGKAMVPTDRFANIAGRQYTEGEVYRLAVEEERSSASHRHYHASVHEAWKNLPHDLAELFPTSEKLRKFALIKCYYANEQTYLYETESDAVRTAEIIGKQNEYAIIVVKGRFIKVYTPESQSSRSMDKKRFQESKTAVLDYISSLIGTSRKALEDNAGKAA